MNALSTCKDFLKIVQTKIGLVFAVFVPLLFTIIWMTGYNGATQRIDQLKVGIVNEDQAAGQQIADAIGKQAPYQIVPYATLTEAQQQMDAGALMMVISIPENFTEQAAVQGNSKLVYYINQGNSDIAKSIMESSAAQISAVVGKQAFAAVQQEVVTTEVVKTHDISNFAISMLPMVLGFVTYIGVMTMNIQLNLSSMMLKRSRSKWEIFWGRQILLLGVSIIGSLIVTGAAMLFADTAASFWQMWGFHILVYIACIAVTQMGFALFGNAAPLFNVALIPFQLMTAGNIIPSAMLTSFYRHIGSFLPAPNAIQGYLRLIYSGAPVTTFVIHLLLIAMITWGITVLRTALTRPAPSPLNQPAASH
ncbi:YhgE/Pip domain-containing protein [Paenibacillus wulumuqiensis]|uniref:YhgE/Pip domain-containing protein n=1 Tax=Paenibacillus wulumuqiensis TaxID=1567107 RepID=UPI000695CB1C|nr:ABC transporter permease [Paenibacillus wulumuqiensis]